MSLLDRIKLLASTHQLSLAELERKLDFSNGSLRKWASSTPSGDKIEKVADYFDVSTDYLFGRTDNQRIASDEKSDKLDTAETQLVAAFRNQTHNMTEEDKIRFNKAIESMMVTAKTIMDDESKWR